MSVPFADLVAFTGYAEGRDPELVRETLTRYSGAAREVIERHGGQVETHHPRATRTTRYARSRPLSWLRSRVGRPEFEGWASEARERFEQLRATPFLRWLDDAGDTAEREEVMTS